MLNVRFGKVGGSSSQRPPLIVGFSTWRKQKQAPRLRLSLQRGIHHKIEFVFSVLTALVALMQMAILIILVIHYCSCFSIRSKLES